MKEQDDNDFFSSKTEEADSPVLESCPICGSDNTCEQGVVWCDKCGAEEEYILYKEEADGWWSGPYATPKCRCDRPKAVWNISGRFRSRSVQKCLDCGATRNAICPECGSPMWTNGKQSKCAKCSEKTSSEQETK